MARHYLSVSDVARRLGITVGALNTLRLPEPDVYVGHARGWTEETIDEWNAHRPGHGGRPKKKQE